MERKYGQKLLVMVTLATIVGCGTVQPQAEYDYLTGNWQGAVKTPVGNLPVAFYISENEEGLRCVLDNPNQSNILIPCGDIAVNEDSVHIALPSVQASYTGTLDGEQLQGHWTQAGLNFHLQLSRLD